MSKYEYEYFDDPVEESGNPNSKKFSSILALLLFIVGGAYFVQSTLAANISLNTGSPIQFGQGIAATGACSGSTNLTVTPISTYTNSTGAFYFSSVKVSNIPSSCYGYDFTISAYNSSDSAPLALFNSTYTSPVVYNNAGTFELGSGTLTGASLTSGSGTFTITFTNPVATSGSVFKVTLQSSAHASFKVGDRGPGGGFIYYVNEAGFSCGATFTSTGSPSGGKCNYLEVAPSTWNAGGDPSTIWAVTSYQSTDISTITNDLISYNNILGVGLGYKNSNAIVTQNGAYNASSNSYAAGIARSYSGGSKNDWYLPTTAELNLLCQWARGVLPSEGTVCTSGTLNSSIYGADSAGFLATNYWSSSEGSAVEGWRQSFVNGAQFGNRGKNDINSIRPIRAF